MTKKEFIEEAKRYQGTQRIVILAKKGFPFITTFSYLMGQIRRDRELKKSELRKQEGKRA